VDILIAEDDPTSALKLRRALEKLGHAASVAADGSEAWRRVTGGSVPLLISDWMMPGLDGLELCRRIRTRDAEPYTYVILLTARDGRDDRFLALEAGADDFLTKPLDGAELVARLRVAGRILAMQERLRAQAEELRALQADLRRKNDLLAEQATTDGLTGLRNRRALDAALETAASQAARLAQPLSLVMLDVDRFKAYNDAFGHPAGDEVLRRVAQTLSDGVRPYDAAARYGGEEFAVVLPATGADAATAVAERLRAAVAAHAWPNRPVTISLGIATTGPPTPDGRRLVAEADQALYCSKARGRDCVTHHRDLESGTNREPTFAALSG
jgi:diguanylate cyclase (GGDEF)-like protein